MDRLRYLQRRLEITKKLKERFALEEAKLLRELKQEQLKRSSSSS